MNWKVAQHSTASAELDELVSHYSSEPISEHLKLTLGVACEKIDAKGKVEKVKDQPVTCLNLSDMPHVYETISDQVPHHYETIPETMATSDIPHHYDTINDSGIYSKGKPTELMRYDWYHGSVSEERAEIALGCVKKLNTFLVRHSENKLILSHKTLGWMAHDIIHRSPEGYHLAGTKEMFKTVPDMIEHYKQSPIRYDQVLGIVANKVSSGMYVYTTVA